MTTRPAVKGPARRYLLRSRYCAHPPTLKLTSNSEARLKTLNFQT